MLEIITHFILQRKIKLTENFDIFNTIYFLSYIYYYIIKSN